MGKKKKEHIVFDQIHMPKRSIPLTTVNKVNGRRTQAKKK